MRGDGRKVKSAVMEEMYQKHPTGEGTFTMEVLAPPAQGKCWGKQTPAKLFFADRSCAIKNFFYSFHPVNYWSGLCTCDTTVTQAVNLIPLWWDSTQCQAQCGHCLSPVRTLGTCTLTSEGIQRARNSCCQVLHQPHHTSDQQSAEIHYFPLVTAKLPFHVKLQLSFIEWFVLIELTAFVSSPQLCPSQGLKGMQGLIFQRCLSGMKERKQWLSTEYPKQHSTNLNANQVIILLESHFIWKSYFCVCIMPVLKLSTQLKTEGLFL